MRKIRNALSLLLVALTLLSLCACRKKTEAVELEDLELVTVMSTPAAPEVTATPEPAPIITSAPTAVPTAPPTAVPKADPTPQPTPVPTPAPRLGASYKGEFASDTGTSLNLHVKWEATRRSGGDYDVKFTFSLECYTLYVSKRSDNTLSVKTSRGTTDSKFTTDAVEKTDSSLSSVKIGEKTVRLTEDELADGADVTVVWKFRGSYSGTDLPSVSASGKVIGK